MMAAHASMTHDIEVRVEDDIHHLEHTFQLLLAEARHALERGHHATVTVHTDKHPPVSQEPPAPPPAAS